jgi:pilus assembly protein CpaE
MASAGEMDTQGTIVWATAGGAAGPDILEGAAAEFKLAVRICTHRELLEKLRKERVTLVGIEFGQDAREALTLVKEVCNWRQGLPVLAATGDTSVTMIRAALQAGATDVLSLPLSPQELHKALIKFTQPVPKAPSAARTLGDVVTVCGARGGLGATTIAVNLAFRMGAMTSSNVALVDLDLQRGDVAAFLNLTPSNSIATLATAPGPVDEIFLAGTLTRHPGGVFVLPAPLQIEDADAIGHDEVEMALRLLRGQFRYVVVDTARTITGSMLAAFEQTDKILVLTDLSVPGVRAARRTFEVLGRLDIPMERVELLVTQARPGPVTMQEAVRAIGKEPFQVIPRDEGAASHAMNGGTTLNGGSSVLSTSLSELAGKLTGVQVAPKGRGLFQRVFSKEARK